VHVGKMANRTHSTTRLIIVATPDGATTDLAATGAPEITWRHRHRLLQVTQHVTAVTTNHKMNDTRGFVRAGMHRPRRHDHQTSPENNITA